MDIPRRVMIDIETTGKTPGCNVLSIGATTFMDANEPFTFYDRIKWDPLNPDFSNEKDTMAWWRNQSQEVAHEAFSGERYYSYVLQDFSEYILLARGKYRDFLIYANGAAYDFPILEYAFQASGIRIPGNTTKDNAIPHSRGISQESRNPDLLGVSTMLWTTQQIRRDIVNRF
jgi:DNA polymerase III epsilon subunit-like protein